VATFCGWAGLGWANLPYADCLLMNWAMYGLIELRSAGVSLCTIVSQVGVCAGCDSVAALLAVPFILSGAVQIGIQPAILFAYHLSTFATRQPDASHVLPRPCRVASFFLCRLRCQRSPRCSCVA
jgi:hypothetical protein